MEDKKAITILMNLLKKQILTAEEKEAISSAIGIFSWTSLAKTRMKAIKEKSDKNNFK
ncbi:MAG: hypothetical protein UT48_C0018G0006 [Parcubacteria group bacterium GW2011_GWE2_39_37]|uniref:Uncharacterized protein n=1 Tax=Candidatus Falkowbacteria bacterium GW2011_GWF2_39_8 TaxID=1618642 RepID=A0A0G0PZF1_9BACT|nr:MAG: hypothetical protein UT48_C0018G0006 [Parcubacteria group bacterium GW2011_GWE2_39_37]KKR33504.1 MAG: hypothetical protein UT64_C0007G0006 [Candidatus Falkowbacteria bacterium GW2011_GWF2_39_8]